MEGQSEKSASGRIIDLLDGREVKWLAAEAGVSASTLSDYLRRGLPQTVETTAKIARALGVSLDYLVTGGPEPNIRRTAGTPNVVEVPVFDIDVAAGAGRTIDDRLGEPVFHWTFPRVWAEANLRNLGALRIFYVAGDSQEPELSQDDLVAVDTSVRQLREGLFVVRLDDQLVAKRIQKLGSRVRLISRNDAYPPVEIDLAERNDGFEVVGEVVWASKKL